MKKSQFENVKAHVIKRAKELNACSSEYKRVLQSENFEQLLQVIHDNTGWVFKNELFTEEQSVEFFGVSVSNLLNSGNWNSGDKNSGDWNSGDWNSGNRNSGYGNSGNWNSGFFNSKNPKTINVFNKPCDYSVWECAEKPNFIYDITLEEWVRFDNMTEEEKLTYPKAIDRGGYLKTHGYKDAWKKAFSKASKNDIKLLKALPNFDANVFKEITGIEIK